jgi:hypothetical protein
MKMTQGIYKIQNILNKKSYVGRSKNIEKRWVNHKTVAFSKTNPKYNYPLSKAIREDGINNFALFILEKVDDISKIKDREVFWYNKINPEYCISNPKYSCAAKDPKVSKIISKKLTGRKLSKEQIDKAKRFGADHHNSKKVKGIHKKTQEVLIFDSYRDAAEYLVKQNLTSIEIRNIIKSISRVVTGIRKSYLGYIWTDKINERE